VVQGEAARRLGELARQRWFLATGNRIGPCPPVEPFWPEQLEADFRDVAVAIARTVPKYDGSPAVREIESLYLAAIAAARHTIYIETQYFSSSRITKALSARLAEDTGPQIIIVNPESAAGWLEQKTMGSARAIFVEQCREADRHGRFHLFTPVTEQGRDIYVHAKVMAIDDVLLRVGSSNLNNRSMGLDTECDLAIEAGTDDDTATRNSIVQIRNRLAAEHLGVTPEILATAIADNQGNLAGAIHALRRDDGRSLRPFVPPHLTENDRRVAESELLNSDRPEGMSETFRRNLQTLPMPGRSVWAAAAIAGLALSLLMLQRLRRR
jgi:phospholipase D1/2